MFGRIYIAGSTDPELRAKCDRTALGELWAEQSLDKLVCSDQHCISSRILLYRWLVGTSAKLALCLFFSWGMLRFVLDRHQTSRDNAGGPGHRSSCVANVICERIFTNVCARRHNVMTIQHRFASLVCAVVAVFNRPPENISGVFWCASTWRELSCTRFAKERTEVEGFHGSLRGRVGAVGAVGETCCQNVRSSGERCFAAKSNGATTALVPSRGELQENRKHTNFAQVQEVRTNITNVLQEERDGIHEVKKTCRIVVEKWAEEAG